MKEYSIFSCRDYNYIVTHNWDDYVNSINADWRYIKENRINPFGWVGKVRSSELPHYHPYWRTVVGFHQYNRIVGIEDTINQMQAFVSSSGNIYSDKVSGAREMICNCKKSISDIKSKYNFKLLSNYSISGH